MEIKKKNASYKVHTATKIMLVMIMFAIFSFFLCVNSVSATWVNSSDDDVGKDYLDTDLLAFWSFTTNGTDITNNGHDCYGNASHQSSDGIIGGYYNFDKTFLDCTSLSGSLTKNFSLSFWLNTTTGGYIAFIAMLQNEAGSATEFDAGQWDTDSVGFRMYPSGGTIDGGSVPWLINLSEGNWEHIVVIYNGTSGGIWVNSTLIKSISGSGTFSYTGSPNLTMGRLSTNEYYATGIGIDEVGLWNRTLNSTEISDLYNSGGAITIYEEAASIEVVTLISPANATAISTVAEDFTANYSVSSAYNITNATYWVWNSTGIFNNTETNTTITGVSNTTTHTIDAFTLGNYNWNVKMCFENSTFSNCTWAVSNYSLEVGASVDAQVYEKYLYETENATFTANVSLITGANLYAVRLVYNGTEHLATKTDLGGNKYKLEETIDIPLLTGGTQNLTFFWQFEYLNAEIAEQNSSVASHQIDFLNFGLCNATIPETFLNITVYNETDKILMNATLDASFDYWKGSGTVIKNYSLDSIANNISYPFCSNQNGSLTTDIIIEAKKTDVLTNLTYSDRIFYFNNEVYNNLTTHTKLFLINSSLVSNIIVQVRDAGLSPLENYYIRIKRYYPSDNSYEIIERPKTDEYGQFVAKLIENTVKYKFLFYDANNTLKKETDDMTIACRATICVLPFVIEDVVSDIEMFVNLTDYDYALSFDSDDNEFTFSWNDVSGKSATMRLYVERYLWNGTTVVCNETSTQRAYILTCDVGSSSASYQAMAFRQISGETERRIAQLSAKVGTEWEIFGVEGLIWSFFLLFTMVAIGYWYPPAGIALYLVGMGALMFSHIIYISPAIFFAQLAIGIAFIWAFKRRTS